MNKGFSLVELIVVIAIMAILVGVAVPAYTNYITDAKEATDINAIDNLEYACKIVSAQYGVSITFTGDPDSTTIVAEIGETADDSDDKAYAQLKSILADSIGTGKAIAADDADQTLTLTLKTKVSTDVKCPADITVG